MQAQMKFKIEILTEKEALELFCKKVGEETVSSNPNIPTLAEKMAKECKGLPLALIVVGSAMAGVKDSGAWEQSINSLTSSSWTAQDLETKVFSILKFSYDKLGEVEKRCFLYCALYPEDCEIFVDSLIDKWMWEKYLCEDMTMSVQDMHSHGESIIEKLKLSCLLESVYNDIFTFSRVDVIRDMALWLLKENHDNMKLVKRILIMNDWESKKIRDLDQLSLNMQGNILGPEFWINLQSLTNLKFLSFENMNCEIPLGVPTSLQQLRVFRFIGISIINSSERRMLEELESLPNIEELWINIKGRDGLNKLLESTKLQSCIRQLFINVAHLNEKPLLSLGSMSGIKQLQRIVLLGLNIRSDQYPFALETCCVAKLQVVNIIVRVQ